MKVANLVDLFDNNSKDLIEIVDHKKELVIFKQRIDYLQYPYDELTERIRNSDIHFLESEDILTVYIIF